MPSTTKPAIDVKNLPTSILIELYTVAVDGDVTEMHKAMHARHETIRRTGYRRAAVSGPTAGQSSIAKSTERES